MIKKIICIFVLGIFFPISASFAIDWFSYPENTNADEWIMKQQKLILSQNPNIDVNVLRTSLIAYLNARKKGLSQKDILTLIDYSKPSTEKRLWVFDLKNEKTLFNTWVSHGKNSGYVQSKSFSNRVGSLKSSIGVFVTDSPYVGGKGYSLRIRGLEKGINNNAYHRKVVIHGASYVNNIQIKKHNYLGRSWGCPAVSQTLIKPLIDTIKGETLIVAYYPDKKWLASSIFLNQVA